MNKLLKILLLSLLSLMLALGVFSAVMLCISASKGTDDTDSSVPYSFRTLIDGSYTAGVENYFADNFAFQEFFLKANRILNRFYYFSFGNGSLAIDFDGGAEQGGIGLNESQDNGESDEATGLPDESEVTSVGTILVHGNRAMDIPTALDDIIVEYGRTIGKIPDKMPENVRVFSLVTPNSGQFYSPVSYHTGVHDQKAMIELCYGEMGDKVKRVDAYSAIAAHTDEYLFFRTDHHWTQKGAYYAYTAFCDAAGLHPTSLSQHESGTYDNFVGSMHHYTAGYPQSDVLMDNPDQLTYYLPLVDTKTKYYLDSSMENGIPIPTVDRNLGEHITNKYLCYISGDTPICVLETAADGGTCLVLKDSYGNAFIPFLTTHYSRIIAVDPREFCGEGEPDLDLAAFVREQDVDDLLILNYPFMMGNSVYIKNLNDLLH